MKKKLPVYRTLLSTLMIGALLWACHDALDPLPDCRLKHLKTTEYIVENQGVDLESNARRSLCPRLARRTFR